MKILRILPLTLVFVVTCPAPAQKKSAPPPAPAATQTQPGHESLDLTMYGRIRDEGLTHSHVMDYAGALFDDIGPRLTGSPNLTKAYKWTSNQFTAIGCSNVHLD